MKEKQKTEGLPHEKEKEIKKSTAPNACQLFGAVFSLRTVSLGSMQDASNRRRLVFCLKNAFEMFFIDKKRDLYNTFAA